MSAKTLLVSLSCLALGLVGAIAYVQSTAPAPRSQPPPAPAAVAVEAVVTTNAPAAKAPPVEAPKLSWRDVESEDYHRYIANLRALGCPEQTIRDIIIADISKLYADRENPLKNPPKGTPDQTETPEQKLERLRQLRAVQQEKRWAIKELLNIDIPLDVLPSSGKRDYHGFEVAFGNLPAEKRDAVQTLQETYWQQMDSLLAKYNQKKTPEYLAETRQLDSSLRHDLGTVLSTQELEDYDIRTSTAAKQLSDKLSTYFRPSEAEFRQIFRAKQGYDDAMAQLSAQATSTRVAPNPGATPADLQALAQQRAADRQALTDARTAAMNQMNDQLKSTLGTDRYDEYQRSQDRTYDLLARLGQRYNLPQDTVLQAYDAQKSFQAPPATAPDPAAAAANRAELQRQLNDRLTTILGDQAALGYRRVNGGAVPLK